MSVTKEKIKEWKEKYGEIFQIELDGYGQLIFRKPTRQQVGMAMANARTNPLELPVVLVQNCLLHGDKPKLLEDPGALVGLMNVADEIIGTKAAEVKKL